MYKSIIPQYKNFKTAIISMSKDIKEDSDKSFKEICENKIN